MIYDGPRDATWTIVLAHGAGQDMGSPFMTAFAQGLAGRGAPVGDVRIARFEFPYMAAARRDGTKKAPDREPVLIESWRAAISGLEEAGCRRDRLIIGGKSLGGRIASMVAEDESVAGLVCLGYPFHPPGKPERLRTVHLEAMRTPTLICQGERDPFGTTEDVAVYPLSSKIQIHWLTDGDHGFKPRKASGRTEGENWESAMDAIIGFIKALN